MENIIKASKNAGYPAELQTMSRKMNKVLLNTGIIGTIVTALCCFTPALVFLFGILGLSSWLSWLDYFLLPALVVFLGITSYALLKWKTS